jgi:sugar phosphate isomerase/epimerase
MASSPWPLAAILPDEPERFCGAVARATTHGFTHVEVTALVDRPAEHLDALADAGVVVTCATLAGDLSTGSVQQRRDTLRRLERQVADAARLGATCVILSPGSGEVVLFTEGCTLLADHAARRMVRLAVRPAVGTCLADVPATLAWLESVGVANLGLALVLEGELVEAQRAGDRLFHVYLHDADLPVVWVEALKTIGYKGVVARAGAMGGIMPERGLDG